MLIGKHIRYGGTSTSDLEMQLAFMKTSGEETRLMVANADGTNEQVLASRRDPDYLNMFWYARSGP